MSKRTRRIRVGGLAVILAISLFGLATPSRAEVGRNEVGFNTHIPPRAWIDFVRIMGATWIRVDNNWWNHGDACSQAIKFYPPLDDAVQYAASQGIKVYMTLAYAPPCGSTGNNDGLFWNDVPDAALLASFVRQSVKHYRRLGVTHFGLWNEPNLGFLEGTADDYLDHIAIPGIPAIRQGCADAGASDCKVLGPELASHGDYDDYLEHVLRGLKSRGLGFDIISHHIYQGVTRPLWEGPAFTNRLEARRFPWDERSVVEVLEDVGLAHRGVPSMEIWITEAGKRTRPWNDDDALKEQRKEYMRVLDVQVARPWYTKTFFYEISDAAGDAEGYGVTHLRPDGTYQMKPATHHVWKRLKDDHRFTRHPNASPQSP